MSNYQSFNKPNPTHGTKNSSLSSQDPKLEHSGPVIKDSLAAESLRASGSFSQGNPTGISDVTANSSTLNQGADTIGFRRVHESEDGGGHVGVVKAVDDQDEKYETPGTGKKMVNADKGGPTYGQNWDGEDIDYSTMEPKKKKDDKDEFGGVNVVDKQPEIGSEEDPGRYAEAKFAERNARAADATGNEGMKGEGNMYDVLGDRNL